MSGRTYKNGVCVSVLTFANRMHIKGEQDGLTQRTLKLISTMACLHLDRLLSSLPYTEVG